MAQISKIQKKVLKKRLKDNQVKISQYRNSINLLEAYDEGLDKYDQENKARFEMDVKLLTHQNDHIERCIILNEI